MPYSIQGQSVNISREPVLKGDKHYIPLREVVEALGGTLTWDNATKTADAVIGPWDASITDGSDDVTVNGNGPTIPVNMSGPAYIEGSEVYVPWDFLRDVYGYQVAFDNGNVSIVNPNA
jgi:hypothetical protein